MNVPEVAAIDDLEQSVVDVTHHLPRPFMKPYWRSMSFNFRVDLGLYDWLETSAIEKVSSGILERRGIESQFMALCA